MEHWHQLSLKIGRKGSNQKGAGHWGQTARWRRKNGCHHRGTEDTEKTPHKNPFYAAFSLCPLCLCGDTHFPFYWTFRMNSRTGPETVLSMLPIENTSDMWLSPLNHIMVGQCPTPSFAFGPSSLQRSS